MLMCPFFFFFNFLDSRKVVFQQGINQKLPAWRILVEKKHFSFPEVTKQSQGYCLASSEQYDNCIAFIRILQA